MGDITLARSRLAQWRISLLRHIVYLLFTRFTRLEVYGRENIPRSGACLLVTNQLSSFDTPLLFALVDRPDMTGLIAANYRDHPLYRILVEAGGGIWIRRGASDRTAIKTALAALERGWIVGVSPEGRRSPTKTLIQGKPGPAFLATRASIPVVPVGLTNTEHLAEALLHLRRITLTVRIGDPFRLPPLRPGNEKQQLQASTDLMMCQIAAMLPLQYRGVYADHPQLKGSVEEAGEAAA